MSITEISGKKDNGLNDAVSPMGAGSCQSHCQSGAWEACFHVTFAYNMVYWDYHNVDLTVWERV